MSQNEMILAYLDKYGSITHAEVAASLGCYRLSARIWELKQRGIRIKKIMEEGLNRFGTRTRYARYTLQGANDGT